MKDSAFFNLFVSYNILWLDIDLKDTLSDDLIQIPYQNKFGKEILEIEERSKNELYREIKTLK